MNGAESLWADPRLVYSVAAAAIATLLTTVWLFRRQKKAGRGAGIVCLVLSIILHAVLIILVPLLPSPSGGSLLTESDQPDQIGSQVVELSAFDPELSLDNISSQADQSAIAPLPVESLVDLLEPTPPAETAEQTTSAKSPDSDEPDSDNAESKLDEQFVDAGPADAPQALSDASLGTPEPADSTDQESLGSFDESFDQMFRDAFAKTPTAEAGTEEFDAVREPADEPEDSQAMIARATVTDSPELEASAASARSTRSSGENAIAANAAKAASAASRTTVPGDRANDFAARKGAAKAIAIRQTGGDTETEAAVAEALRFLVSAQRGGRGLGSCGFGRRP